MADDITVLIATVTPSSDGRLTSRCPSLLGVTTAMGNLTPDYQLLLDIFKFIKTFTDVDLSRYNHQTHRQKLIKYIMYNIIKHMFT
jgi:hypothetical protein